MNMNLDLQWLQNQVGTLFTEIAALRGALQMASQQIDALQLENASLKDNQEDKKSGPQLVAGD